MLMDSTTETEPKQIIPSHCRAWSASSMLHCRIIKIQGEIRMIRYLAVHDFCSRTFISIFFGSKMIFYSGRFIDPTT